MTSSGHRENTRERGSMEKTEGAELLPHNVASHGVHAELLVGGGQRTRRNGKKRKIRAKHFFCMESIGLYSEITAPALSDKDHAGDP
jgi:hypothetical protein